ncbi:hypothetical protein HD806DRAFT_325111 [Xylariaceae sp. AK1471]|nr:hypothetical protein HD806DRAFT_325111 [Xylariaceae sp. AK1471]
MEFSNGMNEVYAPAPSVSPIANIVFVHGLFGGPWKTFATKTRSRRRTASTDDASSFSTTTSSPTSTAPGDFFWPRDLLPHSVKNSRIFSFGYDANIERFMGAAGLNTVHQHGRNLLNGLCDLLDKNEPLPLIIVVHSLGGLVVKEALNQAAQTSDPKRARVLQMTRGIVFLGTPHRGSSAATYGSVAFRLTQIFAFQSANTKLISSLERNSEILDRISTAFIQTLAKAKDLHLWSFAEEKQVRWGPIGMHIVPAESAKIGHERENWGTISGDHRQIAKYRKATDEGFIKVSHVLKGWIVNASREPLTSMDGYKDCLRSLDDPAARIRIQQVYQVSQSHRGSFEWLFKDSVPFMSWLSDDDSMYEPIFWITGKPGSGKSTLMRFALEDPRTQTFLATSRGHAMAYFFHLRGKSLMQKSLRGMLTELLYHTLKQFPEFFVILKPLYEGVARRTADTQWNLSDLLKGFSQIPHMTSLSSSPRVRLFYFIDALDENQDQKENETLMRAIKDIASQYEKHKLQPGAPLLKICLASRPWPFFQTALGGRARIPSIAIDQFTTADIRTYTQALLLQPLSETHYSEDYRKSVLELSSKITSQAKGVFVWVRVVVDNLHQHIVDGTPLKVLENILTSYPDELDELYEHTIRRIPTEYQLETEVALKTILTSRTQLTLRELYGVCYVSMATANLDSRDIPEISINWLASRSGGLLETTTTLAAPASERYEATVQFIHQTVQDFVRQGIKGLSNSTTLSGSYFLAHACVRLFRHCEDAFDYLRDMELDLEFKAQAAGNNSFIHFNVPAALNPTLTTMASWGRPLGECQPINLLSISQEFGELFEVEQPEDYLRQSEMSELQSQLAFSAHAPPPTFSNFFRNYMPILQNLYLFGQDYYERSGCYYAFVAALGPRLSQDRIDRPRMLSRVLQLSKSVDMEPSLNIPTELFCWSTCKFMPLLRVMPLLRLPDPRYSIRLLILLCSALPNRDIDNGTLLAMTEIILKAGASTAIFVEVKLDAGGTNRPFRYFRMSLLHFVARFQRDEAWVSLMLRHGATLDENEFTLINQLVIKASLRQTAEMFTTEDLVDGRFGDVAAAPCAIFGAMLAATTIGSLKSAQACLDTMREY